MPVAISAIIASLLALLMPISLLGEFISAGTLLGFALVCASVVWLRISEPQARRSFRVPYWPVTTAIALIGCLYFLATMSETSFIRIAVWMGIGCAIYFLPSIMNRSKDRIEKIEPIQHEAQ